MGLVVLVSHTPHVVQQSPVFPVYQERPPYQEHHPYQEFPHFLFLLGIQEIPSAQSFPWSKFRWLHLCPGVLVNPLDRVLLGLPVVRIDPVSNCVLVDQFALGVHASRVHRVYRVVRRDRWVQEDNGSTWGTLG